VNRLAGAVVEIDGCTHRDEIVDSLTSPPARAAGTLSVSMSMRSSAKHHCRSTANEEDGPDRL
jgi:hypothetical protein